MRIAVCLACLWGVLAWTSPAQETAARFLKVGAWKGTFSITTDKLELTPEALAAAVRSRALDLSTFDEFEKPFASMLPAQDRARYRLGLLNYYLTRVTDRLGDAKLLGDEYTVMYMNYVVTGTVTFGTREGPEDWGGSGEAAYRLLAGSVGLQWGSRFEGFTSGEGRVPLFGEETYLTIYADDGTYELTITPGTDTGLTGMSVESLHYDTVWEDMMRAVAKELGTEVRVPEIDAVVRRQAPEIERCEADQCINPSHVAIGLEELRLPRTGLLLEGTTRLPNGAAVTWRLEPA